MGNVLKLTSDSPISAIKEPVMQQENVRRYYI
jgi:hypothetical protein